MDAQHQLFRGAAERIRDSSGMIRFPRSGGVGPGGDCASLPVRQPHRPRKDSEPLLAQARKLDKSSMGSAAGGVSINDTRKKTVRTGVETAANDQCVSAQRNGLPYPKQRRQCR